MTEAQLITRVLAGDPAAERALYDAHVDRVYRMVYRLAGDADRAADCVQETFIKAFGRLREFRGDASLGTWIGSIAISVALNALRSAKRREGRHVPLDATAELTAPARAADPDLAGRLHAAIDDLPPGYRTVFLMHDVEGYTHQEIAATLGIADGTSKAQLSRARATLRRTLAAFAPERMYKE